MDLAVIVLRVAVMDLFWGRYRLWPSLLWPTLFVVVMDLAVTVFHVAVMVCGRHRRSAELRQVGHVKILSFGVGDRGVLQSSTGALRKWPSGSSVLNPPLSALRGFLAAARFFSLLSYHIENAA